MAQQEILLSETGAVILNSEVIVAEVPLTFHAGVQGLFHLKFHTSSVLQRVLKIGLAHNSGDGVI